MPLTPKPNTESAAAEMTWQEIGEVDNKRLLVLCYRLLIEKYGFSGTQIVNAARDFDEAELESHLIQGIEISLVEFS